MTYDIYDEDLPEIHKSWAEQYRENKDTFWYCARIVAVPTFLFFSVCTVNYFINKKIGSL